MNRDQRAKSTPYCLVFLAALPARAASYTVVLLDSLGGATRAFGLTETGAVVGMAHAESGEDRAVRWDRAGRIEVLDSLGGDSALAFDSDPRLRTSGYATDALGKTHALLWDAHGAARDLGRLPGDDEAFAFGVNERGEVVGFSRRGAAADRAFLLGKDGAMRALPDLGGGSSQAYFVNRSGEAAGYSRTPSDEDHVTVWSPRRGFLDLGTLGGGAGYALRIDDAGDVVGFSLDALARRRPFFSTGGGALADLGTLGGANGIAYAISNRGEVVGEASDAAGNARAFLFTRAAGMVDLNTLLVGAPAGFVMTFARAIDDAGRIAGYGTLDGVTRAVLLLPR